jgi:hypothetical protein
MKVTNLHSLLMAPPMPIEGLDQNKMQLQELVSVGAVSTDVILRHVVLALP